MFNRLRRARTGENQWPQRPRPDAHVIVACTIGILIVAAEAIAFTYSSCGWKDILIGRSFLGLWAFGFCG